MKAVAYAHTTAALEANGAPGLAEQEAAIRAYAEREGLQIAEVYTDDPIGPLKSSPSLGTLCSRSGLVSLLDDAETAGWLFVVVASLQALQRGDVGFDALAELAALEKRVVVVGERLGLEKPGREKKPPKALTVAERLLRGREAGARAGRHQSGPAPYGYRRKYQPRWDDAWRTTRTRVLLEIDHEEAEVVRAIFKEYLRRKSMKRLIEWLNAQGIRTRRGKQWSRAGVSWILKNETYLGRVRFGKIRAKGRHPAIIAPITLNRVQKLIRKNNKRGGREKGSGQRRKEARDE